MTETTLYINLSDSRCGYCRRNADPQEVAHTMNGRMAGTGCGAKYVRLSSDYAGGSIERSVMAMRPDLPWFEYWTATDLDKEED